MSEMADAIRALQSEKGMSEESIKQTIENAIKAAYKRTFGTAENCIVKFDDGLSDVKVYSRKVIVDGVYDPSQEIELEEALTLSQECAVGDEIDIEIDPHTFARSAVSTGKQTAHQALNESFKDTLYNEYKNQIGQIKAGNYQRERNGNIFIDVGKVEAVLPVKNQSPREAFEVNERIRALLVDIKKTSNGIQLVLSRTDPRFVQNLLEQEVPEIQDKIVSVYKTVREPGYRTKIAVYSNKVDVDPVGACVGLKGVRIQNVIRELESEKIDVLKYDEDPHEFIKNALLPAEVKRVVILDKEKKEVLAIVAESQFSLAIGKQGLNVRLANRLCDWNIDVKTEEQAAELDLTETDSRMAAEQLFAGSEVSEEDVISTVSQLPGVNQDVAAKLAAVGIEDIDDFLDSVESGKILDVEGITQEDIDAVNAIINENVVFENEEPEAVENAGQDAEESDDEDGEKYYCPECGAEISLDMTHCPKCGVELIFEEE
ncbi:MAG: transcription termination factor NusA [Treponema sp.]|nr:transcription termination factor NusA [Treponema sp.]